MGGPAEDESRRPTNGNPRGEATYVTLRGCFAGNPGQPCRFPMSAKTMRAISKLRPGPGLDLTEVPVPVPGPNDVLIRVKKTSICGTDVHIYNWDEWAQRPIRPPMVIGHEFVGVIEEVGANVQRFQKG